MNIKKHLYTYFPGILLFLIAVLISLLTYKDYGISWDEYYQREIGTMNYDYVVHGNKEFLSFFNKDYGAGFEIPLMLIERKCYIHDIRDVYLMRHLVTHLFYLISMFFGYVLIYRLFKNQLLACFGFFMLAFSPAIYAHSFFNTKDIPFLCMLLISLTISQVAFEKKNVWLFLLLGIACGYTTGIRIMGIMLVAFLLFFLMIDICTQFIRKEKPQKTLISLGLFIVGFCGTIYLSWPYLWGNTVNNFISAYTKASHFVWDAPVLLNGKVYLSQHLPRRYFPVWFLITNPVLWLVLGFIGVGLFMIDALRKPMKFLKNSMDRNFLIYFLCFSVPIIAVIWLHSVIYDGWRHLYFIYPSFILMALYFINKVPQKVYRPILYAACLIQAGSLGYFMVKNHPAQELYFNSLVSHDKEYLRKNYEFDYWGPCYKQALDHLVKVIPTGPIKLCFGPGAQPTKNNVLMLHEKDRNRVELHEECDSADYFITGFRWHPADFPNPVEYSLQVLNSTAVCVYKVH